MSHTVPSPSAKTPEAEPAKVRAAAVGPGGGIGSTPAVFDTRAGSMDNTVSADTATTCETGSCGDTSSSRPHLAIGSEKCTAQNVAVTNEGVATPAEDGASCVDTRSSLALPQLPGIEVTALGVNVTKDEALTQDTCHRLFALALSMHRASNWILGDALLLCERTWGNQHIASKYDEAAASTGISKSTLMSIVTTCRAFPRDKRHDGLTFTHHLEAAHTAGSTEQREEALQLAEDSGMSCRDLRKHLRAGAQAAMTLEEKRATTGENDDRPFGLIDLPSKEEAAKALPIAYELSKAACWLEGHPADTLNDDHKSALKERLQPLIDYARTLDML